MSPVELYIGQGAERNRRRGVAPESGRERSAFQIIILGDSDRAAVGSAAILRVALVVLKEKQRPVGD